MADVDVELELQRLDQQLASLASRRQAKWEVRYEKLLCSLRACLLQYRDAFDENQRQRQRRAILEAAVALGENEVRWRRLLTPMDLPQLGGTEDSLPPSAISVSLEQLPHPDSWDRTWVQRCQALSTRELLELHKQWLQSSALLLPKVEAEMEPQAGSLDACTQLTKLGDKYICFTQRVMELAPAAWHQRALYDLDTYTPVCSLPDKQWMIKFTFGNVNNADLAKDVVPIFLEYQKGFVKLRSTRKVLTQRHQELSSALEAGASGGAAPSQGAGRPSMQEPGVGGGAAPSAAVSLVEYHAVVEQLRSNMDKEAQLLRHCVWAIQRTLIERKPLGMLKAYLQLYPLALDVVDFLDPEVLTPHVKVEVLGS